MELEFTKKNVITAWTMMLVVLPGFILPIAKAAGNEALITVSSSI